MPIFSDLYNAANDSVSLDTFLQQNYAQFVAFCSTEVNIQRTELDDFEQFVLLKSFAIENLDYTQSYNRAFVYYLMDYCERFCSTSAIVRLYQIIKDNNLAIGSRLEAAMSYLYNVPSAQVFVDRFDEICSKIQTAINEEEDDDNKAIATFLNYYSYVVYNTSEPFSQSLLLKYSNAIESNSFPFLANEFVAECLAHDIHDAEKFYHFVQNKIDEILGKGQDIAIFPNIENDYIIEKDTEYAKILTNKPHTFQAVRKISVQQFNLCENKDDIFYSLGRGVKILKEETQLFSYINSYGRMHEAKMISALKTLPLENIDGKSVEIVDWACGQGLASIILQEFIDNNFENTNIKRVILIEPSEIALSRAALHVRHFNSQCQIKTILKDIDSICYNDILNSEAPVRIHLFSNILDVDGFSMQHLISIVEQTLTDNNYFICVSPYITDAKTARIDEFVQHFARKYNSFQTFSNVENRSGEWINSWSRVVKVFKA